MAGKKGTKYYASRRLDTTKIVLILIIKEYIYRLQLLEKDSERMNVQ